MKPEAKQYQLSDGRQIDLRPAVAADAEAALIYLNAMFMQARHWVLTEPDEFTMTPEQEAAYFEAQDWAKGDQAWLAWEGGRVVGSLNAHAGRRRKVSHRVEIGMSVHADLRGLGLGGSLMDACIATATANPAVSKLVLEVFADNLPAIGLYRKLGFVEEGHKVRDARREDGHFVDGLLMGLWVGDPSLKNMSATGQESEDKQ